MNCKSDWKERWFKLLSSNFGSIYRTRSMCMHWKFYYFLRYDAITWTKLLKNISVSTRTVFEESKVAKRPCRCRCSRACCQKHSGESISWSNCTACQRIDCWSSDILLLCNPVGDWVCMPSGTLFTDLKTVTGNRTTAEACTPMYTRWHQLRWGVFYAWTDNFAWSTQTADKHFLTSWYAWTGTCFAHLLVVPPKCDLFNYLHCAFFARINLQRTRTSRTIFAIDYFLYNFA